MKLKELLQQQGATVVDVRTQEEFEAGHVPGSVHIPLDTVEDSVDAIDRLSRPVILCCRSGHRSGVALDYLEGIGLKELYNGGGWEEVNAALD